jgi:hypothetical protein
VNAERVAGWGALALLSAQAYRLTRHSPHPLDALARLPEQWERQAANLREQAEQYSSKGYCTSADITMTGAVAVEQCAADLRKVLGLPRPAHAIHVEIDEPAPTTRRTGEA